MILVVSPNLAVDLTLPIRSLERGSVHRTSRSRTQAGGKGVNLARAIRSLGPFVPRGEEPFVLGFASGFTGEAIAKGLASERIAAELIPFPGESRICAILLEDDGTATVVNEAGPEIREESALLSRFDRWLERASAAAFMGSLPPGLPSDLYARMVRRARESGIPSLVDTSGEALAAAVRAGPTAAKPNRAEAEALLGRRIATESDRRDAAARVRKLGAGAAMVTFGAEGFLLSSEGELVRFSTPPSSDLRLGNPTGAGDALAAGYLAGLIRGDSPLESGRLGAAAAAASLAEGYGRFRAKDVRVEAVVVERLD